MKTLVMIVIIAVLASLLMFWVFPWSKNYLWQSQEDINQSFADKIRSAKLPELAQQIIADKTSEVQKHLAAIIQAKDQLQPIQDQVEQLKAKIASHDEAMKIAWAALDASKDQALLTINGNEIARADVIADIELRTAECENLRLRLKPAETSFIMLTKAVSDGETKILEAKRILEARKSELDSVKITLEAGDALKAVQQLTDKLANGPGVAIGEDPVFKEIRARLAEANATGVYNNLDTKGKDFINYSNEPKDNAPKNAATAYRQQHLVAAESAPVTK